MVGEEKREGELQREVRLGGVFNQGPSYVLGEE